MVRWARKACLKRRRRTIQTVRTAPQMLSTTLCVLMARPTVFAVTNCSNNYAKTIPRKLIPLFINNIVEEKLLPVYGDGQYTRDWLYVVDHARAIDSYEGENGETYNIGGFNEWTNIDLIKVLCAQMDEKLGREKAAVS